MKSEGKSGLLEVSKRWQRTMAGRAEVVWQIVPYSPQILVRAHKDKARMIVCVTLELLPELLISLRSYTVVLQQTLIWFGGSTEVPRHSAGSIGSS